MGRVRREQLVLEDRHEHGHHGPKAE